MLGSTGIGAELLGLKEEVRMKAMVLREFCEIELEGEARKRTDLPLKKAPLEMAELPAPGGITCSPPRSETGFDQGLCMWCLPHRAR